MVFHRTDHNALTLTCYLIDDEYAAIETGEDYVLRTPGLKLAGSEQNAMKAKAYLGDPSNLPDIILMDIAMKGMTGIELTKFLADTPVFIIFSTGHAEYALQSYDLGAVDYLLKPFTYERFLQAIEKCRELRLLQLQGTKPDAADDFYIKDTRTYKQVRVVKKQLRYLQGAGNYCYIYPEDNDYLMVHKPMKEMLVLMNSPEFFKIHKSYVINLSRIASYTNEQVTLTCGTILDIGKRYRKEFKDIVDAKRVG